MYADSNGSIDFRGVLKSFIVLINALGSDIWLKQAPDYPEVVLYSIKDNSSMSRLLLTEKDVGWAFAWLQPYLESVWNKDEFSNVIAKAFIYLGEELQHAAYDIDIHVHGMSVLLQVRYHAVVLWSCRQLMFET